MKYDCCKVRVFTKPFSVASCLKLIRDQKSLSIRKEIGSLKGRRKRGCPSLVLFFRAEGVTETNTRRGENQGNRRGRRTETKGPQTKQKASSVPSKEKSSMTEWVREEKGVKATSVHFQEKWEKRSKNCISKYDELRCVKRSEHHRDKNQVQISEDE